MNVMLLMMKEKSEVKGRVWFFFRSLNPKYKAAKLQNLYNCKIFLLPDSTLRTRLCLTDWTSEVIIFLNNSCSNAQVPGHKDGVWIAVEPQTTNIFDLVQTFEMFTFSKQIFHFKKELSHDLLFHCLEHGGDSQDCGISFFKEVL